MANATAPRVEEATDPAAVTEMQQIKAALGGNRVVTSTEVLDRIGGESVPDGGGPVHVFHSRGQTVRLYKPGGGVRVVPANGFDRLIDQSDGRWRLSCEVCGTDCGGSPWGCGLAPEPTFYECPVPGCNDGRGKKFYNTVTALRELTENSQRIEDPIIKKTASVSSARANLYSHIWNNHPDQAAVMGLPKAN